MENDRRHAQRLTGYAFIAFITFGILLLMVGRNAMVSFIRPASRRRSLQGRRPPGSVANLDLRREECG
jgi:hypothetical protein